MTPVQRVGSIWVKRDDLYEAPGGALGGKARTCQFIAEEAQAKGIEGIVTAGSRKSPQVNIVAQIGRALGMPVRVHTPTGEPGSEVTAAIAAGAKHITHFPGYNGVITKRAEEDAKERGWALVPFGMQTREAVTQTACQVHDLPPGTKRIVVPVGSGMSLAGILHGLWNLQAAIPVLGVRCGADPTHRLNEYASMWMSEQMSFGDTETQRSELEIVDSGVDYHEQVDGSIGNIELDPIYEAKCLPFLEPDDLLWIVGIRQTLRTATVRIPAAFESYSRGSSVH